MGIVRPPAGGDPGVQNRLSEVLALQKRVFAAFTYLDGASSRLLLLFRGGFFGGWDRYHNASNDYVPFSKSSLSFLSSLSSFFC